MLLTLADVFSKLYSTPNAVPKYRLLFLLTESSMLLNFQGVKKWLDENVQLQVLFFSLFLFYFFHKKYYIHWKWICKMLLYGPKEDIVSITGSLIAAKNPTSIKDEVWARLQVKCLKRNIAILADN